MRFGPEAKPLLAGVSFGRREFVFAIELGVAPGVAFLDLFEVDETVSEIDASDLAAIAIDIHHVDADRLAVDFVGQAFFRLPAVRLPFFGRVDAEQADPVLRVGFVEHGQRIAVGDRDDSSRDDVAGEGLSAMLGGAMRGASVWIRLASDR